MAHGMFLARFNNSRRLSKECKTSIRSARAVCQIAAFHTLLKVFSSIAMASASQTHKKTRRNKTCKEEKLERDIYGARNAESEQAG